MLSVCLVKFDEFSNETSVKEEKYFVIRVFKRERFTIQTLVLKFFF